MKKIKFVGMTLALAFGVMGAGFAAWTEDIKVNAQVTTGTYDVLFSSITSDDDGTKTDPGMDKNVAKTEVTPASDNKSFGVTIDNAYPGYNSKVSYTVKNNGSIPIKITGSVLKNLDAAETAIVDVVATDLKDKIVEPGQTIDGTITHTFKNTDNNTEKQSIGYDVEVTTVQWNEGNTSVGGGTGGTGDNNQPPV
ncbi:hypothetical protein GJ688_13550 [Heliobacillus mobilis]|uniref:SipW-cognate class signal peptide n=1 Tax=Heliobacterium mobile TaxID=28064 RepID=A0A6I3SM17_HELMO|nr:hypothetical protein [Heliobacterium mobile]MTV50000.1 hypothetical protein [Heliobacterium mobile]